MSLPWLFPALLGFFLLGLGIRRSERGEWPFLSSSQACERTIELGCEDSALSALLVQLQISTSIPFAQLCQTWRERLSLCAAIQSYGCWYLSPYVSDDQHTFVSRRHVVYEGTGNSRARSYACMNNTTIDSPQQNQTIHVCRSIHEFDRLGYLTWPNRSGEKPRPWRGSFPVSLHDANDIHNEEWLLPNNTTCTFRIFSSTLPWMFHHSWTMSSFILELFKSILTSILLWFAIRDAYYYCGLYTFERRRLRRLWLQNHPV